MVATCSAAHSTTPIAGNTPTFRHTRDAIHPQFQHECAEMAARARRALGDEDWELLAAHHLDGFSLDELAHRTGSSRSAVKSRLYRARARLEPAVRALAG